MKKFSLVFTLIFLFSSCAPATTVVPEISTGTNIPTSTNTPTAHPTITPTLTSTPTLTPTPTLIPRTPITTENAKDIQLLNQISGSRGADIAWSPDGGLLALAGNHEIILFDSDTLQQQSSIPTKLGFFDTYLNIMFSYDGTRILIAGYNRTERHPEGQIFDVSSGEEISKFTIFDDVKEFCAPGDLLTSDGGKTYYPVFCALPEKTKLVFNNTLAFSPDYMYSAVDNAGTLRLMQYDNAGSSQSVWDSIYDYPWGNYVKSADFSPDGKIIAAGFLGGDIHLYDVKSGREVYFLVAGLNISGLSFSPDGSRLAYSSISSSGIIDLSSGYQVTEFGGTSSGSISDIEFSPDGRWLATTNIADNFMLWDVDSGKLHYQWPIPQNSTVLKTTGGSICQTWASHFAFSPDGQNIALTRNGVLQLTELYSHQVLWERQIEEANSITFSPDGKFLATGTSFDVGGKDTLPEFAWVRVYDASNGYIVHTLRGIPGASWNDIVFTDWHYNCVVDMAFTADSRTLAVADMGSIRFWDMQSGEQIQQDFDPKMNEIQDIEISDDGYMLAVINRDGRAKVFPFKDGQISQYTTQDWSNLRWGHLAFIPDGNMIGFAYYRDGSILLDLWELTSKAKRFSDVVKESSFLSNYKLDFSNDSSLLALEGQDGVISIYGLKP